MEQQTFSDLFRRYFALLRQWAWLLVLAVVLTGGAAFLVSRNMSPVYQASTIIMIDQAPDSRLSEYQAVLTSQSLLSTYARMLTARPVLEEVILRLGIPEDVEELSKNLSIQPVRDTQLIQLEVENSDPRLAAQIANTIVEVFTEYNTSLQEARYAKSKQGLEAQIDPLDQQIQIMNEALAALEDTPENQAEREHLTTVLSQYRQTYAFLVQSFEDIRVREAQATTEIVQIEQAVPPQDPARPRVLVNTLLAAVVGFILAIGTIFLIEALDDTIKSPEEINWLYGLPVLGFIKAHQTVDGGPVTLEQPQSPVTESFRSLRTNIQYASVDNPIRTLLITSASSDVGKTTISTNLAIVMAQGDRQVVLVDSDLRCPKVHQILHLQNREGLSGLFVQKDIELDDALQQSQIPELHIMTSGGIPPNPSELLSSEKMSAILERAHDLADIVVIDSAPILSATDTSVMSRYADGVLIVIKPGVSKRSSVKHALEQLKHVDAKILGVVFNGFETSWSRSYNYYQD